MNAIQHFDPERLAEAETRRRIFDFIIPAGTTVEELLQPERWRKMTKLVRPWDRIEVRDDAGTFWGEMLVRGVDSEGVHLVALRGTPLDRVGAIGSAQRAVNGERIEHRGEFLRWCVVRGDRVLSDKHTTEAAAANWLGSYLANQARGAA